MANIDTTKFMTVIVTLVVCVTLTAGVLIPVIEDASGTIVTHENEGAGSVRFSMATGDYLITMDIDNTDTYIVNGTDRQPLTDYSGLIYADENVGVYADWDNGTITVCGVDGNGTYGCATTTDAIGIQRTSEGVEISNDHIMFIGAVPSWAYIPDSNGKYGWFENGTEITVPDGTQVAYFSETFAGVTCYNGMNNYDLPITLDLTQTGNKLSGAKWVKALQEPDTNLEPLDPNSITIQPLDPGVINPNPEPDVSIMSVPTPTYTDGDWGYDTKTVNGVTKAVIVSYSGAGGGAITVPATIGGYDVYKFGKGGAAEAVFDSSISATDLIFSNGIQQIDNFAVYQCIGFTGNLVIPSSVTTIGWNVFAGCRGFTGNLVIPSSVTSIGYGTFSGCRGFTGNLVIPSSITTIESNLFTGCNGLTGNLVIPSSVTSIGLNAFQNCSGFTGDLVIPSSVTSIGNNTFKASGFNNLIILCDSDTTISANAFDSTSSLKTVLNLGTLELTTTSYGLNADEISDNVPAMGYMSAVEYTEGSRNTGPIYDLLPVIPLMIFIGLAVATVGAFMYFKK